MEAVEVTILTKIGLKIFCKIGSKRSKSQLCKFFLKIYNSVGENALALLGKLLISLISPSICPKINLAKKEEAKLIREVGEAEKATLLEGGGEREALYKIDCLHTIASKEFRVRLEKEEMTHFVLKAFFATISR